MWRKVASEDIKFWGGPGVVMDRRTRTRDASASRPLQLGVEPPETSPNVSRLAKPTVRTVDRKFGSGVLFLAPIAALWIIPIVIFLLAVPAAGGFQGKALQSPDVQTVRVGSLVDFRRQAVDITLAYSASISVKAGVSGTVTGSVAKPETSIKQGTPLVVIDGSPVLAFEADAPLYRDIGPGMSGADVRSAGEFLADQDLMTRASVSDQYGPSLRGSINAFESSLHLPADGTLHQAVLAWVPPGLSLVGSAEMHVGDQISAGAPIFTTKGSPTRAAFSITGGDSNQSPQGLSGTLRLTAGKAQITLGSLAPNASDRAKLAQFLDSQDGQGIVTSKQQASSVTYSGAVIELASAQRVGTVPSNSISVTATGHTCVFRANNGAYQATTVDSPSPIDGELSSDAVSQNLAGIRIVRDPISLPRSTQETCK